MLGLQPCAEPGIVNLRLVPPKVRRQPTLNLEMVQMQLDHRNMVWEITADIGNANVQSSQPVTPGMCLDNHRNLLPTAADV
jgi:hypothetical protein